VFLQFAQRDPSGLPLRELCESAARHFQAELRLSSETASEVGVDSAPVSARLEFAAPRFGSRSFLLTARATSDEDRARLEPAEALNQSYGMAGLGRRCRAVWELSALSPALAAHSYYFGALLASVALGPLLPPDGSGLFGVRSARIKADELWALTNGDAG